KTAKISESGTTGQQLVTLHLVTSGSGTPSLATAITSIRLAANADYSSDAASFSSGATEGTTATLTVTATDDQLVEGPELFTATLAAPTSNASVTTAGSGTVSITDNDTATATFTSASSSLSEDSVAWPVGVTLTLNTQGSGAPGLVQTIVVRVSNTS